MKAMQTKSKLLLAFLAATAASTAIYDYIPRNVDATVFSTGGRARDLDGDADPIILGRFIDTDKGRAAIGLDEGERFHNGQQVTCVVSHDFLLRPSLHDCRPK
jgi:hypothetical protein